MKRPKTGTPPVPADVPPGKIIVDLTFNVAVTADTKISLGPVEAEVVYRLAERAPAIVHRDTIVKAVYGLGQVPPDYRERINTHIQSFRRKISEHGFKIVFSHAEQGYQIIREASHG